MTNLEIANTILDQIRATDRMALWAWGAKDFMALNGSDDKAKEVSLGGVQFKVNGAKHKGTVVVNLMANDTYTVTIGSVRKGEWKVKTITDDVYCDNLMEIIDGLIER
jgi:hypothetical protein